MAARRARTACAAAPNITIPKVAGGLKARPFAPGFPRVAFLGAESGEPRLLRGQSCLGSSRDHAGLQLGHSRHLLKKEAARWPLDLGHVAEPNVEVRLHEAREEGHGRDEAVDLRHKMPMNSSIGFSK